jgi:hypothetical protein
MTDTARNTWLSPLNIFVAVAAAVATTANLILLSRSGSLQNSWLAMKTMRQQLAGMDAIPKLSQLSISDIIDRLEGKTLYEPGTC